MPPVMPKTNRWVWIDLEMTGLDPKSDRILEIATVVTDDELNVVAKGPVYAVQQSAETLEGMNAWCQKQHKKSGLVERVVASTVSEQAAEAGTLAFLKTHVDAGVSPMCGNSVWKDRTFLAEYMPTLEQFFHYRLLDVSTLKILANQWHRKVLSKVKKAATHLALDDIIDSIEELKVYRTHFLNEK